MNSTVALFLALFATSTALVPLQSYSRRPSTALSAEKEKASYAIIGCGVPGRGMGWFHGLQLIDGACDSAMLSDVVEPWFLGGGRESDAGKAFGTDCVEQWEPLGVDFSASVEDVFQNAPGACRIALIAGRTNDNPKLFREAIEAGATHILLEKPGAPSVAELESMAAFASDRGVPVFMGFIKNIAQYVSSALEVASANDDSLVTFESLNAYSEDELGECFARNSEGMLKNMAIHELALVATYFNMRADNIASVSEVNGDLRTIGEFTDFKDVAFTLTNEDGTTVRIKADRCGGDGCSATVSNKKTGDVLHSALMVDEAREEKVARRQAEHPEWISYLLTQEDEYQDLKERCAKAAIQGAYPESVATIQTAIEALKLAEYLTPLLKKELLSTAATSSNAPTNADSSAVKAR